MKRLFITILSVFLLSLTAMAQTTYAVITGVSNYEGAENDLTQSTKDAKSLASLYKSKGATVVLLTSRNATRANIIAAIRKVKGVATANDRIIFSYSGHGVENKICSYASSPAEMLSYDDLFRELDQCTAKNIVCYIDACYSGTAVNSLRSNSRYIVFLSSRSSETSSENRLVGAGLLTNGITKGLRGKADSDGDKNVTVMELFKYIHKDVQVHNKKQHPQLVTSKSLYNNVLMSW